MSGLLSIEKAMFLAFNIWKILHGDILEIVDIMTVCLGIYFFPFKILRKYFAFYILLGIRN